MTSHLNSTSTHIEHIDRVAAADVAALRVAELHYGSSWKRRGGIGAFMMLARKWDRIENALRPHEMDQCTANMSNAENPVAPWDVFAGVAADPRDEGLIDDIRDLRRYLMLVEAELVARGVVNV